jgi:hypothetical protein
MAASQKKSTPDARLPDALGASLGLWIALFDAISADFSPLARVWKPTKLEFGLVCLIKQKERTLAYLIPSTGRFEVSIVLGNRAAALALGSDIRTQTKKLISEARIYAEGRGVRFFVESSEDVLAVVKLLKFKTTPP